MTENDAHERSETIRGRLMSDMFDTLKAALGTWADDMPKDDVLLQDLVSDAMHQVDVLLAENLELRRAVESGRASWDQTHPTT